MVSSILNKNNILKDLKWKYYLKYRESQKLWNTAICSFIEILMNKTIWSNNGILLEYFYKMGFLHPLNQIKVERSPFTDVGGFIECRPSLGLFNALGLAFQRFLESGWFPNWLAKNRIFDFPVYLVWLNAYLGKHSADSYALKKIFCPEHKLFIYPTILNIWKILCFFAVWKLTLYWDRFIRFIFILFRNLL